MILIMYSIIYDVILGSSLPELVGDEIIQAKIMQ